MGNMTFAQIATQALSLFTPGVEGSIIAVFMIIAVIWGMPHHNYSWAWGVAIVGVVLVTIIYILQTTLGITVG